MLWPSGPPLAGTRACEFTTVQTAWPGHRLATKWVLAEKGRWRRCWIPRAASDFWVSVIRPDSTRRKVRGAQTAALRMAAMEVSLGDPRRPVLFQFRYMDHPAVVLPTRVRRQLGWPLTPPAGSPPAPQPLIWKTALLWFTLCNPMDYSPPGSSVRGTSQGQEY